MRVEHEVRQGAFQPSAEIPVDREARHCNLGGAGGVEDAERFPQLPMGLGRERELARLAPAADLHVVEFRLADWNALMRKVRQGAQNFAQLRVDYANPFVKD